MIHRTGSISAYEVIAPQASIVDGGFSSLSRGSRSHPAMSARRCITVIAEKRHGRGIEVLRIQHAAQRGVGRRAPRRDVDLPARSGSSSRRQTRGAGTDSGGVWYSRVGEQPTFPPRTLASLVLSESTLRACETKPGEL